MRIVAADDPAAWDEAARSLLAGSVVAIPTDTLYGLAVLPDRADALFELKGRDHRSPIAVLVADQVQAEELVVLDADERRLAERHWPGALTIVATAREGPGLDLGGDGHTLGVRCPADGRLRSLLARVGPLAVTSANRSGEPPLIDADSIATLSGIALILDGGPLVGPASTVVHDGVVLRSGPVVMD